MVVVLVGIKLVVRDPFSSLFIPLFHTQAVVKDPGALA
jgi:hypothetical protein